MAIYKCKMCGGDLDITDGVNVVECDYCGTNQTVPYADNEKKVNLFNRANRLRMANEFDKAAGIYESIAAEFPEEAEAYWGICLCKYGIEYVDDPKTAKKIPTCHRTSFESIFNDSNFELALEYADPVAVSIYRSEAKEIDYIQKSILEIANKEEPFDIFICYKETAEDGHRTKDSVLAQDMYDALTKKGYNVFFSRITLEDKLGQEYEPYIFSALNSAKIMLAVGTKYEYYNAVWVKNEWGRFLDLMKKDKEKVLIPCYADIDAYDMPQEFKNLQGQDMGKIGFIQDLVRGIGKIVPIEVSQTAVQAIQTVQVIQSNSVVSQTEPLLKRAFMFLDDGNWKSADEYCEKVLDIDSECGKAYLGKLMAKFKIPNINYFDNLDTFLMYLIKFDNLFEKVFEYGNEQIFEKIKRLDKDEKFENLLKICTFKDGVINKIFEREVFKDEINIVIPKGVTAIGDEAFEFCVNLKSVIISDGVKSIGKSAFWSCENLTSITMPNTVTSIGDSAFLGCKSLTSVTIPNDVTSISYETFGICESLTSVTIPNGVTSIGDSAFLGCKSLTSVIIPDSVTLIGKNAFGSCESLTSIRIPNSVSSIGDSSFSNCESLASITISDGVKSIGKSAFSGCKHLTSIIIPNTVTSIGDSAFCGCESLISITIPNSVTFIGIVAFYDCKNLKSINVPNHLYNDLVHTYGKDMIKNELMEKKFEPQNAHERFIIEMKKELQMSEWKKQGVCKHCGGSFKGFFIRKCSQCGMTKDY